MKTTLAIATAIIMPGGLIILAISLATFYLARRRAYARVAQRAQLPA
jgi:hypothetical protein